MSPALDLVRKHRTMREWLHLLKCLAETAHLLFADNQGPRGLGAVKVTIPSTVAGTPDEVTVCL